MWPLGVLASVITALTSVGAVPMWPRVVHLVALPPIDLYTDFRLLLVHAPSWPTAGAAFVGAMALRIAILGYLMGALSGANLALAARFYSILSVPVFIAATSVTVVSTMPNARFFWSGLGILALSAALVTALPWQGSALLRSAFSSAWRRGLRWEVVLPYFAVLTGLEQQPNWHLRRSLGLFPFP